MAQKTHWIVTARSITTGDGKTIQVPSAGQAIGIITQEAIFIPQGTSGEDTLIVLPASGYQIRIQESYTDFATAISATSITGS